eukprot:CAMPEP_0183398986 /NCGR_PEP_ID=MMETSP0370-20130417/11620_1 /TAXON_ID=268820 /ORGANISM="Peridinium aciculiferum, Strain PAER-2" /LENGTH=62 /DNA_ID=CAMNT_0025580071 /DNA_START=349 /DNA_END=534 /DNA_ORIENTATION=-
MILLQPHCNDVFAAWGGVGPFEPLDPAAHSCFGASRRRGQGCAAHGGSASSGVASSWTAQDK